MKPSINNTFCYYPFYQLSLKGWEANRGIVEAAPCCNSQRAENNYDPLKIKEKIFEYYKKGKPLLPIDIFLGEEFNELRNSMLSGKKHPGCEVCWKMEENKCSSYRLRSERLIDENIDLNDLKILSLDLGLEENCNLRCRMCQPGVSNQLRKDLKFFKKNDITIDFWEDNLDKKQLQPNSENDVFYFKSDGEQWKNILDNIDSIKIIKATGGETLLSKSFNQLLDTAIEKKCADKIILAFHTNATVFTKKIIDKLNQFKKVSSTFSIDSVGKTYEYIRYPMTWNMLEKSVNKYIRSMDRTKIDFLYFNSVITVYSAFNYEDYCKWIEQLCLNHDVNARVWIDLSAPEKNPINVTYLPHKLLEILLLQLEFLSKKYDFLDCNNVIGHIENVLSKKETADKDKMLHQINAFDLSRNQDYHDFLNVKLIEFLDER